MKYPLRQLPVTLLMIAAALPGRLSSQTAQSTPQRSREGSWPFAIFVLETCAFGSGFAAGSRSGARVVGTIDGISGLVVLGAAAFSDRDSGRPEFSVPWGAGLLALSYYNFASASSDTKERKLWTNVIGVNATAVVAVLSAVILRPHTQSHSSLTFRVTPSSVRWDIPF